MENRVVQHGLLTLPRGISNFRTTEKPLADLIELTPKYSTTSRVREVSPEVVEAELKAAQQSADQFKTILFQPGCYGRKGAGGLRTQGYFKKSSEDEPLITVITVVFNAEKYLAETIGSIINQTYQNLEFVIIDGGSTDKTLDIIKQYECAIDYWVSEKDEGVYDAMNKGIDLATGEWINFMNCGDTFFEAASIEKVFDKQDYGNVDIIYGNHQVVYSSGRKRNVKAGLVKNLWKGSQFCHQASFIKTGYHKINKFNICTKIVADFEFFYNARKENKRFKLVNITVACFRAGGVSDSKRIDSILGHWLLVDKSLKNNIFYSWLIIKESLKSKVKCIV